MKLIKKLVFKHNLSRARHFKKEKDKAERGLNQAWSPNEASAFAERLNYCNRELTRYLRALGQEV